MPAAIAGQLAQDANRPLAGRGGSPSPGSSGGGIRFGHYEVSSLIGRGGMAAVYRGTALEGRWRGRPVAIKRLLPELVKDEAYVTRFLREAALSQQLSHPYIVTVYESGIVDGAHFIAMELVDGRDLAQVIRRCADLGIRLPVDFAVFLAHVLLEALESAHQAQGPDGTPLGIVHCDVSPSNLFISRTGDIKLGDFGVARSAAAGHSTEIVAGKPYYLSPEVIDGRVGPEADLWAAAATLYELLTLHRPFAGERAEEVFEAICHGRRRPVRELRPEVPEPLAALLERAFSPSTRRRFPTAASFAQELEAHYDERVGTPLGIAAVVRGLFGLR
ncbi:MAG: serine/threonine protein kinase [Deltaproteobacteria bacterium]|nr:serine/threonine protein kinase [Deltaproteobacteria bacterium]